MDCAEQKAQLSIKLPASALDSGEAVEQVSMRAAVPVVEGTLKLQGASKWSADMWLGRSRTPGVNSLLPRNTVCRRVKRAPSTSSYVSQAAFDQLDHDTTIQRALLAQAKLDASDQRAGFQCQLARAALDNADQKALFESQMAKAMLDAGHMKVEYRTGMRGGSPTTDPCRPSRWALHACSRLPVARHLCRFFCIDQPTHIPGLSSAGCI